LTQRLQRLGFLSHGVHPNRRKRNPNGPLNGTEHILHRGAAGKWRNVLWPSRMSGCVPLRYARHFSSCDENFGLPVVASSRTFLRSACSHIALRSEPVAAGRVAWHHDRFRERLGLQNLDAVVLRPGLVSGLRET
jgi:hypothetical protein